MSDTKKNKKYHNKHVEKIIQKELKMIAFGEGRSSVFTCLASLLDYKLGEG